MHSLWLNFSDVFLVFSPFSSSRKIRNHTSKTWDENLMPQISLHFLQTNKTLANVFLMQSNVGTYGKCFRFGLSNIVTQYNVTAAYKIALQTWANWLQMSINPQTQKVYFMSLSPTHLWWVFCRNFADKWRLHYKHFIDVVATTICNKNNNKNNKYQK